LCREKRSPALPFLKVESEKYTAFRIKNPPLLAEKADLQANVLGFVANPLDVSFDF
jgi:hypothetical protein